MAPRSDTQILNVSCRARPKRLAYLIDAEATSAEHLDKLFAYSMAHWGGRLHAIIPVVQGEIADAWWKPLQLLDPDLIVTFCDLSSDLVGRIERDILPYCILGLNEKERKRCHHDYVPAYGMDLVGIKLIPQLIWLNRGPLGNPEFVRFKWQPKGNSDYRMILRNFGVVMDDVFTQAAFRGVPVEDFDETSVALSSIFDRLAELGSRCVLPVDLAAQDAAFPARLHNHPVTRGFHLVVGDGPYEAAYSWNRHFCAQSGMGRSTLWVPSGIENDASLVVAISNWIQRCYWEQGWACTGQIVSYTLEDAQLHEIANLLSGGGRIQLNTTRLTTDQFPFPDGDPAPAPDWAPSVMLLGGPNINAHVQTQRISFSQGSALIEPPIPPVARERDGNAAWMVDLQIQFHPDRYAYTNVRPDWILPKRDGLAVMFTSMQNSRILTGGLPSVETRLDTRSITITIPQDRDVFSVLLLGSPYGARQEGIPVRRSRFRELWTSDEGAALRGMIRLFGGLWYCGDVFQNPFWRRIFLEMTERESPRDRYKTLSNFIQRFGNLRKEALVKSPEHSFWTSHKSFDEWMHSEFNSLVKAGVFRQGTEIRCSNCGSYSWYAVEDLRPAIDCLGCGDAVSLPTEAEWFYRVNELIYQSLHSRGTLAVIQSLFLLERESREMFLMFPSQNLAEERNGEPITDVDIVVLVDGLFVIGETKSSPNRFDEQTVNMLADLAKDIRPDRLVFAAPGNQWPEEVIQRVDAVHERLAPLSIDVRKLTMQWF